MNPKRMIIVSSMAIAITIGAGIWSIDTNSNVHFIKFSNSGANTYNITNETENVLETTGTKDDLQRALGVSSDEEIHDALYNGYSLANIADGNQMDVQKVIDLQVTQLNEQLDINLAKGNLTGETYLKQKSEVVDIITKSVYGIA
jgi:hypothetical protein